ncbi:disease resistance protein At4g27190-like [Hibiscus syriacus]|uniref:disease resistance protein At4g27190-like n=1 Tax=Hibiscus syriacus TaxID=106335 RepID=UPI001922E910|nr:disease resistance protein At4g27190-like [Hibiscus syriacus]XP_039034051.1 disease resistance protein At4g27190-like [Hibiscus syriacus]
MEVLFAIVGSLAAKAAEYTVDPTARQLGYLFKPRSKSLNLQSKVQYLKDARERVQQSVEAATRKGELIFDDVQRWLTVTDEKISEQAARQLREDEEKATKGCFVGFCPDFKSRYQLSRKAEKEANAIAQLLSEKDAFEDVSYLPAVEVTDIIRPVKEFEAFGSRSVAFDGLMETLEDDTVSKIGVYGMGGVGKTTLVKEIARQAKVKLSFDEVVFVAVTQTPKTVNLQNEIANQLGMKLDNDPSPDVRAARLCDRLKKSKKVLVILDDIWEEQEVDTLGIPSADQHRGCKILMTSRRLVVLKRMDSQPNISIETLKEDEAWKLFKKMAGHIVECSEIRSIAVEVVKRCAGLPIAIATIAKALKPKDKLFEWRDALRQLSKPSKTNFEGIPAYAYKAIELSYKFLEGDELGPIFLLCSIMGHNATVEELLRYVIGLGFIHDVNTMEESRGRVLTLVNNLTASCLLLEDSHPNCFDMHDVVRDAAQSIASRDRHWLALFKELPNEKKMKESQLISLQNAEVNEILYHELECPTLNYFSIGMDRFSSLKISNDFFKGMQRLKVLEFGKTNFTTLPSSLGFLKTLCTLRLIDCDLEDIAIFGELENLEILDLRGSRMEMLPKEIGQLTRIKLLDLTECRRLKVISPNVLSSLSRLEEL